MSHLLGKKYYGEFHINGEKFNGEIFFNGLDTQLEIWSDIKIQIHHETEIINGFLYTESKTIALLDSILLDSGCNSLNQGSERTTRYFISIHPRLILLGTTNFNPAKNISSLHLSTKNLARVFLDRGATTRIINPDAYEINKLIQKDIETSQRLFDIKDNSNRICKDNLGTPSVYIYKGKKEILLTSLKSYSICLYHHESQSSLGWQEIKSKISTTFKVDFHETTKISDAILISWDLLSFMKFVSGQEDDITSLQITTENAPQEFYNVYISSNETSHTDAHFDGLLNSYMDKSYISGILKEWLLRQPNWIAARGQICSSYSSRKYSIERLTKSANIFDMIPSSKGKIDLSEELNTAKTQASKIFKSLPPSIERDSILNAIGRIGTKTLKHKIRERIDIIEHKSSLRLEDIRIISDHCVDCRNYYVHGGENKINYEREYNVVHFFTDTLEFIFVVSDLIECGWNIDEWLTTGMTNHKISYYLKSYSHNLNMLLDIIKSSKQPID